MNRSQRRRPRSRSSKYDGEDGGFVSKLVAGIVVVAVLLVLGGILLLSREQKAEQAGLDTETFCPKEGPAAIHAVLIDRTDGLGPIQAEALHRRIVMWARQVPKQGLFEIYEVSAEGVLLKPVVALCNPGDGSDLSMLTANPEMAKKRYKEKFEKPVRDMLAAMRTDTEADRSPIFEAVQSIAVTNFGPDTSARDRKLIIVSDFLQYVPEFSLYRGIPDYEIFRRSAYGVSSMADLSGVEVELHLLHRKSERSRQSEDLVEFWIRWLEDQGAIIGRYSPLPG